MDAGRGTRHGGSTQSIGPVAASRVRFAPQSRSRMVPPIRLDECTRMTSILKRWFGRADVSKPSGEPKSSSDYRVDLIPALHAEHQELLALFGSLERASKSGDEVACRSALDRFTRLLQQHLLAENRHLYGYFARNTDPNPGLAQRVETMSAEMLQIGKTLHRFITTYSQGTWNASLREKLEQDIPRIGSILTHRIHEEETQLYPLYLPRAS